MRKKLENKNGFAKSDVNKPNVSPTADSVNPSDLNGEPIFECCLPEATEAEVLAAISSVEWVQQSASAPSTDNVRQAELVNVCEDLANGGVSTQGKAGSATNEYTYSYKYADDPLTCAVFPTFGEHQFNQAKIEVTLNGIPAGKKATVHLKVFDPNNKNSKELKLKPSTLTFTGEGTQIQHAIATFQEGFGDNYIVAVHPTKNVLDTYVFGDDNVTLESPAFDGFVPDNMRTRVLCNAAWNGFKVPEMWDADEIMKTINIVPNDILGKWNYSIKPTECK